MKHKHVILISLAFLMMPFIVFASETKERPNILLIVVDDMGYSDLGSFGGEIKTPNIDSLADEGAKFTNFYAGPSCSATRAMLLSGNDNHISGLGNMYERMTPNQMGKPGYEGFFNDRVVSIASILKDSGYHTYMAGKWHLGHAPEQDPSKRGFERSYTLLQGGASHFDDEWMMYANYTPIYREDGERSHVPQGFFSTEFYSNQILKYIDEQNDDKPFFAYLALTAPHDPIHVPDEWLDRYKGKYTKGYNELRSERLERMKKLQIVPQEAELGPWAAGVPKWSELTDEQRSKEIRQMEIYSAMVGNIDYHIGRVLQHLENSGKKKDTLILFFSDNGANGFEMDKYPGTDEAWVERNSDNRFSNYGKRGSRIAQGPGWAQASSTPFHLFKHYLAEGGIRVPLIMSGPGVAHKNETVDEMVHVMDLVPTFIELAGTKYPAKYNGKPVEQPLGKSMLAFLSMQSSKVHDNNTAFGWEYNDLKAIRVGNYKATLTSPPFGKGDWQLFDLNQDPGESNDLSSQLPEVMQSLINEWTHYADAVGVVPLEGDL